MGIFPIFHYLKKMQMNKTIHYCVEELLCTRQFRLSEYPLYRQWTHVFKILREIDLLYEYYGHFHHVINKTKNIGGTIPV